MTPPSPSLDSPRLPRTPVEASRSSLKGGGPCLRRPERFTVALDLREHLPMDGEGRA